jgi:hypothetical protein
MVGCGSIPDVVGEDSDVPATVQPAATTASEPSTATPQPAATPLPTPIDEAPSTPEVSATPEEATPVTEASPAYSTVEVPEAGLSFELPESWVRLEPDWVWVPEIGSDLLVGVKWLALEAPQEVEAAMLPGSSEVVSAEVVDLELGMGRQFLLRVFEPAIEGSDAQAQLDSMQMHILVTQEQAGKRLAYDFFASGADAEQLAQAEAVLRHLVETLSAELVLGAAAPPSTPAPDAALKAVAILAQHLGIAQGAVELANWEYVEWSDACLGIHKVGIMCAQVITPGYRITLTVGGKTFELHTNQSGSSVGIVTPLLP